MLAIFPNALNAMEVNRIAQQYPILNLMGIVSPDQFQSYSLSDYDDRNDILKITYRRTSGSLLPTTRKYEFDRTAQTADLAATGGDLQTYEISRILNAALLELDSIMQGPGNAESAVNDILRQIGELERDFVSEMASLRAKVKALDAKI